MALQEIGYVFLYLPDVVGSLDPAMVNYVLPGIEASLSVDNLYQGIRDIAKLGEKSGFLYEQAGHTYFRSIPASLPSGIEPEIDDFVDYLRGLFEVDANHILVRKSSREESLTAEETDSVPPVSENAGIHCPEEETELPLDPETLRIIRAWKEFERKYGVTIEDITALVRNKVKLSRLSISTTGSIVLPDFDGKQIKMDTLTKAVYIFFLKHPEGAKLKELYNYEEEILGYYLGITGRDDLDAIKKSVHNFLDPYGNNLNTCMSRIRKAFKDAVTDNVAKFYYVGGGYAETHRIAIDRDFVIWAH